MVHTCRGTISLHGAIIHTEDSCTFVISNGGTQTFHIKAANEVERQRWVTMLELAKAKAIRAMESGKYTYIILDKNKELALHCIFFFFY
jgi:ureidoglycolate hydrolase